MNYRITFNKPTDVLLDDARAINFRTIGDDVSFYVVKSANDQDHYLQNPEYVDNLVPLSRNERNIIEATISPELAEKLTPMIKYPYYLISPSGIEDNTWYNLKPFHVLDTAPQKHHQWMRLWIPRKLYPTPPLSDDISNELGAFTNRVRQAKEIVDQCSRGRPTKEISDSKRVLQAFRNFVIEIGVPMTDNVLVEDAIKLLQTYVAQTSAPTSLTNNIEDIAA